MVCTFKGSKAACNSLKLWYSGIKGAILARKAQGLPLRSCLLFKRKPPKGPLTFPLFRIHKAVIYAAAVDLNWITFIKLHPQSVEPWCLLNSPFTAIVKPLVPWSVWLYAEDRWCALLVYVIASTVVSPAFYKLWLLRSPGPSLGSPLGEVEGAPLWTWKGSSQQLPGCCSSPHKPLPVFQLMGWVFGMYFSPSFYKYCTINTSLWNERNQTTNWCVQSDKQGCI